MITSLSQRDKMLNKALKNSAVKEEARHIREEEEAASTRIVVCNKSLNTRVKYVKQEARRTS